MIIELTKGAMKENGAVKKREAVECDRWEAVADLPPPPLLHFKAPSNMSYYLSCLFLSLLLGLRTASYFLQRRLEKR